eukprot:6190807-Pleurochrysis_carterae.AAC.2
MPLQFIPSPFSAPQPSTTTTRIPIRVPSSPLLFWNQFAPLRMSRCAQVFDKDKGVLDRDDRLGSAKLPLGSSVAVGEPAREVSVPLSTQGSLKLILEAMMVSIKRKTLAEVLGDVDEYTPLEEPKKKAKHMMPWEWFQRECSHVTLEVTLKGAVGLRAADRGGKSDPYAKIFVGKKATAPAAWRVRRRRRLTPCSTRACVERVSSLCRACGAQRCVALHRIMRRCPRGGNVEWTWS